MQRLVAPPVREVMGDFSQCYGCRALRALIEDSPTVWMRVKLPSSPALIHG